MHSLYNQVAGKSVERLAALSDGIFAVAMTLLVLDLHVPAAEAIHSERDLLHSLIVLSPRLVIFLMSIMTNGIFWVGQQTQLNQFERADRNLAWIHIAFLCAIMLTPFTTSLLAEYIHYRTALLVYWFNIFLLGLMLYWSWRYASRQHLLADDAPEDIHPAVIRRIVVAQSLYAAGAALGFINTYYSIAAIVLVQVNYAIAPRLCWGLFAKRTRQGEQHARFKGSRAELGEPGLSSATRISDAVRCRSRTSSRPVPQLGPSQPRSNACFFSSSSTAARREASKRSA